MLTAKGLNQALISTTLFFSGDLTKIQIPTHSIEALDGQTSLARATESDPDVPSVLIRLSRFEVLGDPIENIVLKSGLLPSKSWYPLPLFSALSPSPTQTLIYVPFPLKYPSQHKSENR